MYDNSVSYSLHQKMHRVFDLVGFILIDARF